MSDHVIRSEHDSDGMGGQFMHLHGSVWMAHWRRISNNEAENNSLEKERLETQSVPKFNHSQSSESSFQVKNVTTHHEVISETGTSSRNCNFKFKGISQDLVNPCESLEKKSFAVSTLFQHDVGSSSRIVSHGYNNGKSPSSPFFCRQEEINQSNPPVSASKELFRKTNHSRSLNSNHERKSNDNTPRSNRQSVFVGKRSEEMQKQSGIRFIPNQISPSDETKSQLLLRNSLHDTASMRICNGFDSLDESSGGNPKFSQTIHHFLIRKKNDVMYEGGQMFRDSTFSINLEGKLFSEFLGFAPGFEFHGRKGLKLQPLGSSTDSEGKEVRGDAKNSGFPLKNVSSETNAMDMDVLPKSHPFGMISSQINKITNAGEILSTSGVPDTSCGEEAGNTLPNTTLPDMNEDPPAQPDVTSSVKDRETSSSRTQSLDVEDLVSHAEFPKIPKSSLLTDDHAGLDPNSRWVKRLKLNSSFAQGAKSSEVAESSSSPKKVNKLFSKIVRRSISSSEPPIDECPDNERMAVDQVDVPLKNTEKSLSLSAGEKIQDVTLSHPWIQRWCHCKGAVSPTRNHEPVVVCDPLSIDTSFDEFQKKQFPSIAAMALMGKALTNFRTCEFKNKGSCTVWNT